MKVFDIEEQARIWLKDQQGSKQLFQIKDKQGKVGYLAFTLDLEKVVARDLLRALESGGIEIPENIKEKFGLNLETKSSSLLYNWLKKIEKGKLVGIILKDKSFVKGALIDHDSTGLVIDTVNAESYIELTEIANIRAAK